MQDKIRYEKPEAEILFFEADDVIITSPGGGGGDTPTPPVPMGNGLF